MRPGTSILKGCQVALLQWVGGWVGKRGWGVSLLPSASCQLLTAEHGDQLIALGAAAAAAI